MNYIPVVSTGDRTLDAARERRAAVARPTDMRLITITGLLVLLLAATGCGSRGDEEADPDEASSPQSSPTSPVPPASTPSTTSPPTLPTDAGSKVRVVGVVVATHEDHTVLRDDNGIRWALVGEATTGWATGARVQAVGRSRPDLSRDGLPVVKAERVTVPPASR